eukprot:jgi/Bigna1/67761/fgenesh1_pg.4_\
MTLVKDDYRWSSIRHIATVVLLIFTAMTNSLLVLQIKKILSGRSVAMEGKASDSDDESEDTMVVDTEKAIQKRLNILLCIYIPISLLGTMSGVILLYDAVAEDERYSSVIVSANAQYSPLYDFVG